MIWRFSRIFSIFYIVASNAYLICNNSEPLNLELNTLGFFHSDNYPLMSSASCNYTFNLNVKNSSQNYIISTIYDFAGYLVYDFDIYVSVANLSQPSLYFLTFNQDADIKVYKGFVIYELSDSKYPLEFTKDKPLLLEDDSQIMYLFSSYNISSLNRTYPCIWQFTAPPDYGFKIFFVADLSINGAKLIVENTTDIFINTRSYINAYSPITGGATEYPFYNPDNYIKITLFPGHALNFNQLGNKFEFKACVSIVKKNYPKMDKCFTTIDGNTTIWSNYNTTYEIYENNMHCRHKIIIPQNSEVFISAKNMIEPFAEYFVITDNEKNISRPFPGYVFNFVNIEFMLFSINNNTHGNNVTLEFISDGSVQYGGFSVTSTVIDCKCGTPFISCDNNTHFAMPDTPFLCGNLRCNYTMQKCSSRLAFVEFNFDKLAYPSDIFRIISNNIIVYEIPVILNLAYKIYAASTSYNKIINSTNDNIFEIITQFSDLPRSLTIRLQPLVLPPVHIIELKDGQPTYIIDMQEANYIHVKYYETNLNNNQTFILYCNYFQNIEVFDNENFTKNFNVESSVDDFDHVKIKGNEFVILQTTSYVRPIFLIVSRESPKGCVFKKNVIFYEVPAESLSPSKTYSAMSNELEECPIFVSTGAGSPFFKYVWTTSSKENVKVYIGSDQKNLFFEFNSATAKNFQYVMLLSDVYTIILPKSSSLLINIDYTPQPIPYQHRSIFATPYFGTFTPEIEWTYWKQSTVNDELCYLSLKFTTMYHKLSKNDIFYFTACTTADTCVKYYPKEIGEVFIFEKMALNIYYKSISRNKDSGIIFLIENLGFCDCDNTFIADCLD